MSTTVNCENLSTHFSQSDDPIFHTGFTSIEWLYEKSALKTLETGSREYQREKVASEQWKQNLMRTILCSTYAPIPGIHVRVSKGKAKEDEYSFELIDGQQRVTSILDFLNGKYSLPEGMITYDNVNISGSSVDGLRLLFPQIYDRIKKYRIATVWYENLDENQVSDLFVNVLNNTNDMNDQEMRNALRGQFTAWVRNHARFEKVHPLFARTTEAATSKKKERTYLKYIPNLDLKSRMEVDQWLTQLIYMYEHGLKSGVRSQSALTHWVKNIQSSQGFASIYSTQFSAYNKRWNNFLDFAQKVVGSVEKSRVTSSLTPMVAQVLILYAHETEKVGNFKISDMSKFTKKFFTVIDKWSDQKTKVYADHTQLNGNQMPPMKDLFGGKNPNAVGTVKWILDNEFDLNTYEWGVKKEDPRESFSHSDIVKKWIEQDKKCYYTGRLLEEDELVGDHYIPRSWGILQGGVTEYQNLVVTDRATNTSKSLLHGDDFKRKLAAQKLLEDLELANV